MAISTASIIRKALVDSSDEILTAFKKSSDFDTEAVNILNKRLNAVRKTGSKNIRFDIVNGFVYDSEHDRNFPHSWIEYRSIDKHANVIIDITGFRYSFMETLFPLREVVVTDVDAIVSRLMMHLKFDKESFVDYMMAHAIFDKTPEIECIYKK